MDSHKILVITNMWPGVESPYSGIFVKEQCEQLEANGHDVHIVDISSTSHGKSKYVKGRALVKEAIAENDFDIAHIHYGLTSLSCAGLPMPPAVVTFHGADIIYLSQRGFSLWGSRAYSRFICVSPKIQTSVPDTDKTIVLPCGVPESKYQSVSKTEARSRLDLDPDAPIILFPGCPDNLRKNYALFEEAFQQCKTKGLQILKFGTVEPSETPYYFKAADATILTSHSEGSPQVVKESIFSGTPVVSVDVGDVAQYLPDIPGCSVTGYNAEELAHQIDLILKESPQVDPTIIRERFGLESVTRKLEHIYTEVLKECA